MRKKFAHRYIVVAIVIAAAALLLDMISKIVIHDKISMFASPIVIIPGLIAFTHTHNTGAAFSFGADNPTAMTVFIVLTFVALVVIALGIWKYGKRSNFLVTALALLFAGALGNLLDRLRFGYVDDFIKFIFWDSFAIFNVADVCVCIGAVLFVIYFLFFESRDSRKALEEKNAKAMAQQAASEQSELPKDESDK